MNAHQTINNVANSEHWVTLHQVPSFCAHSDFPSELPSRKSADASEWLPGHNRKWQASMPKMQDGDCPEVARMLHARGIPFVVYSTVSLRGRPADPSLRKGTFLKEPSGRPKILAAVR